MPEKLTYREWIGSPKNDALPIATANKHNLCMKVHANCHLYMQSFETNIFEGKDERGPKIIFLDLLGVENVYISKKKVTRIKKNCVFSRKFRIRFLRWSKIFL